MMSSLPPQKLDPGVSERRKLYGEEGQEWENASCRGPLRAGAGSVVAAFWQNGEGAGWDLWSADATRIAVTSHSKPCTCMKNLRCVPDDTRACYALTAGDIIRVRDGSQPSESSPLTVCTYSKVSLDWNSLIVRVRVERAQRVLTT